MLTLFMAVFCFQPGSDGTVQELIHNNPFNWERVADMSKAIKMLPEGEFHSSQFLEAADEEEASLALLKFIANAAARSGVTLNSINMRKPKPLTEDGFVKELRTYFGYDANLGALVAMFEILENGDFPVKIQNLTISARSPPPRMEIGRNVKPRSPLNGNVIVSVVYSALQDETQVAKEGDHAWSEVFTPLLSSLAAALPEGSMLTHVQIKKGNSLTIQGEALDLDSVHEALLDVAEIKDVQPGNTMMTQGSRGQYRFMYKAVIDSQNL